MSIEKDLELIKRGAVDIIQIDELNKKLEQYAKTKKPLVIKAGFDPTAPDIHLGHTVLIRKMKHFQDLGHKVIFLIGDATALVGDPSGQSQTRKTMTWDEVEQNAKTYEKQVGKILNVRDTKTFERRHNSEWFSKGGSREKTTHPFTFENFVELTQKYTVARLLERDDFQKRLKEARPISFLEFFYPLMQGYDSVMLKSDVEIGGTDQRFNMLVGRDLQQAYGQAPQVVIAMPLLVGLDGVNKMSKSLGNYIGINEPAKEIFGKIMSVTDELMYTYYELLTDEDYNKIRRDINEGRLHPKQAKINLAKLIVKQYYSESEAKRQEEEFERAFRDKGFPQDAEEITLNYFESREGRSCKVGEGIKIPLLWVLTASGLATSNSDARRKIAEGAVEINFKKIIDPNQNLPCAENYNIRLGKKFKKINLK